MEIVGSLQTVAIMALLALFVTEVTKRIMVRWLGPDFEDWFCWVPIPLALFCIAMGILLAYLAAPGFEGMSLIQGAAAGFVAAAFAAYGFDFVNGALKGIAKLRSE